MMPERISMSSAFNVRALSRVLAVLVPACQASLTILAGFVTVPTYPYVPSLRWQCIMGIVKEGFLYPRRVRTGRHVVDVPRIHLNKTPALFSPVLSARVPVVQVPVEIRNLKIRAGDSVDP